MSEKVKIKCVEQECDFEFEGTFSILNENQIAGSLRSLVIKHHVETRQVYPFGLMWGHSKYLIKDSEAEIPVIITGEGHIGRTGLNQEEREHLNSLKEFPTNKERE